MTGFDALIIGGGLPNQANRTHLTDLEREHLIDEVCLQEILPPER